MGKLKITARPFGDSCNKGVEYYFNGQYIGFTYTYPNFLFKCFKLREFIYKHGL